MKASTIVAIAVTVGVLLILFVQAAIIIAGNIGPNKMPTLGAGAESWTTTSLTPAVFLVLGLIFGLIAGTKNSLNQTLIFSGLTALIISGGLVYGAPKLVHYVQYLYMKNGETPPFAFAGGPETIWSGVAAFLWVCWFVMGSAMGYKIRNRRKAAA